MNEDHGLELRSAGSAAGYSCPWHLFLFHPLAFACFKGLSSSRHQTLQSPNPPILATILALILLKSCLLRGAFIHTLFFILVRAN